MSTRMLIDARHPEETRVTVVKGSRVEDFDYESATRRQLKGNIYLARITRVEPSLQAAFVEYGGNRHGFLAFSEIHPDYYQIPLEDREAIIEAETQAAAAEKAAEDDEEAAPKKRRPRRRGRKPATEAVENKDAVVSEEAPSEDQPNEDASSKADEDTASETAEADKPSDDAAEAIASADEPATDKTVIDESATDSGNGSEGEANADDIEAADVKESEEDEKDAEIEAVAESRRRNIRALKRRYSIQEVIKRRQVLLIQVVKEERGNKGAALTTYMSLAGRYCVLMPNSTHSGGISRKISNLSDRKKLKQVINSLDVQEGMGLIVRTAGINRTKTEIKRDYDYLLRLWNGIRDLTLKSTAPALIYEEGSLIKRTIRDVYTRDIDEVWVEGERGYRAAKDFMKLLMPSHAKKVQNYKDRIPLYQRYQVEDQLEAMYQPVVQLKSGGYIVINPTEALISIDVNSGRATKESNIEETAVKTNLEAAEEVARQLRLRDMAGLVVIDYIDMEDRGNNRAVERRMKDVLKSDRARIQVGRISSFGLMEMSRQRLRPNLLEVAMETCSQCAGTGLVRSVESAAIKVLRQLEEEGIRNRSSLIRAKVCPDVAVYLLNQKRAVISALEHDYKVTIHVIAEVSLAPSDIEITHENNIEVQSQPRSEGVVVKMDHHVSPAEDEDEDDALENQNQAAPSSASADDQDDQPRKKRRRRRRRRRGGSEDNETSTNQQADSEGETSEAASDEKTEANADDERKSEGPSRRRRGSRGGRRRRGRDGAQDTRDNAAEKNGADTATETADGHANVETTDTPAPTATAAEAEQTDKPVRRRRRVKKPTEAPADATTSTNDAPSDAGPQEAATGDAEPAPAKRPARRRSSAKGITSDTSVTAASDDKAELTTAKSAPRTRRKPAKDVTEQRDKAEAAGIAGEKPEAPKKREASGKSSEDKKTDAKKPEAKTAEPAPAENSQAKGATAPPADADKKSGWWQRTFG